MWIYEVYVENQEYELVTFGSFILDKILDLSFKLSNTCIRCEIAGRNVSDEEFKCFYNAAIRLHILAESRQLHLK